MSLCSLSLRSLVPPLCRGCLIQSCALSISKMKTRYDTLETFPLYLLSPCELSPLLRFPFSSIAFSYASTSFTLSVNVYLCVAQIARKPLASVCVNDFIRVYLCHIQCSAVRKYLDSDILSFGLALYFCTHTGLGTSKQFVSLHGQRESCFSTKQTLRLKCNMSSYMFIFKILT